VIGFKQRDVEDKVDFGGGWKEEFIGNLVDAVAYKGKDHRIFGRACCDPFRKDTFGSKLGDRGEPNR